MFWKDVTRLDINQLDKNTPVVIPMAAIEQHGDHLPVSTDLLINESFCKRLNDRLKDQVLIIPSIAISCSGHHLDLGGTLTVSHQTFFHYVRDVIKSIFQQKFKKVILFNSHGGNQAIGETIVESVGLLYPENHIFMTSWWKIAKEELVKSNESGFGGVGHAGEFETSLIAAIAPSLVIKDRINDSKLNPLPHWAKGDLLNAPPIKYHRSMREFTGDGVFGKPTYFSLEKGEKILQAVTKELIKIILEIKEI